MMWRKIVGITMSFSFITALMLPAVMGENEHKELELITTNGPEMKIINVTFGVGTTTVVVKNIGDEIAPAPFVAFTYYISEFLPGMFLFGAIEDDGDIYRTNGVFFTPLAPGEEATARSIFVMAVGVILLQVMTGPHLEIAQRDRLDMALIFLGPFFFKWPI